MARRKSAEMDVRIAFEASRIASQCLADAYERLIPIARRPTRPAANHPPLDPVAATLPLRRSGIWSELTSGALGSRTNSPWKSIRRNTR